MLQNARSSPIQGFILDPTTSHALQDESCAPLNSNCQDRRAGLK